MLDGNLGYTMICEDSDCTRNVQARAVYLSLFTWSSLPNLSRASVRPSALRLRACGADAWPRATLHGGQVPRWRTRSVKPQCCWFSIRNINSFIQTDHGCLFQGTVRNMLSIYQSIFLYGRPELSFHEWAKWCQEWAKHLVPILTSYTASSPAERDWKSLESWSRWSRWLSKLLQYGPMQLELCS